MKFYSMTDRGRKRELNEDYIYASGDPIGGLDNLFAVADGMGGHLGGDYASEHTVKRLGQVISSLPESDELQSILSTAISEANAYVHARSMEESSLSGMGSTLVLATVKDNQAIVANIGDSRLYLIRENEMIQVTKDHSYVEEMVSLGELDRDAARNHPDKNIITRAIGVKDTVLADFFTVSLQMGDRLLLCSDGLTNMLQDHEILSIVQRFALEDAVKELIRCANDHGGRDNIAAVLVEPFGGCQ